jgi:hypothetical protein
MPVPQAFQAEKPPFELPSSGAAVPAPPGIYKIDPVHTFVVSTPIAFHATAGTRRAEFGMVRDLADELGGSTGLDLTLELDVEALAAPAAP